MKGKKRILIVVFALILSLVTVIALTACADDEETTENWKTYMADAVVTDTGFSAQLVLDEGEFASSDKADFVLSATVFDEGTEEITDVPLDNFTLSKTDKASVLEIAFTDEKATEHGGSWFLNSNKAVTSAGEFVSFAIYVTESSFSFSCSTTDFSSLSEKVVVDCELYGATLKESFSVSDIELDGVLEGKPFTLTGKSDTEFSLDFGNPFTDGTDGYAYITLKASAVNTLYPVDSTLSITLENIPAETVFSGITVDGDTATVPLKTSFGLFEGIVKEDITLVQTDFDNTPVEGVTVESVVFEGNELKVTFAGENIAAKLNKAVIAFNDNNALQEALFIGIGDMSSFLTSSTTVLKNNDVLKGYSVEFTVNNGYFDGLTKSDVTVSADGATFDVNSIDRDSFVIDFTTSLETLDVEVTVPASKVVNDFGIAEDVVLGVQCIGSEPDKAEILSSIGMGIAKGLGGKIGEAVGGKIYEKTLEPILETLGIAPEDPLDKIQESLDTLQDSVKSLGQQMERLSRQISDAVADIKNHIDLVQYQNNLMSFNSYFNKINLFNLQNYGDKDGLAKVMLFREQYRKADGVLEIPADKQAEYDTAMNKFVQYVATTGDWTNIIADIKTFGENIVSVSAGVNGGYLEAYWKYIEIFYPFNTLTIEPKSAFLDGAMGNYTLAVNAVLIYCDYAGSTAVAQTLIDSYHDVYEKALPFDQNITDIKTDLQNGKIYDYDTKKYYSSQVSLYKAHKEGDSFTSESHTFELSAVINNIETIIGKSHTMGMDLITALKKAGFVGLQESSNGNYRIIVKATFSRDRKSTPYKLGWLNTYIVDDYNYYGAKILVYNATNKTYSFSEEKVFYEKTSYLMTASPQFRGQSKAHKAHEAFYMLNYA